MRLTPMLLPALALVAGAATLQNRVNEVQVAPATQALAPGATARLHALAYDAGGNVITSGVRYAWSSANVNVARVDSTGVVTAVALGTTLIRAEAIGSGNPAKSGAATVTVRR